MKLKDLLACAATGMILCTSCIKNEAPNAEADILNCTLPEGILTDAIINYNAPFDGEINAYPLRLEVHNGTDLTQLAPTFELTPGATITPANGSTQNFTRPVRYEVTSEDGQWHRTYSVSIQFPKAESIPTSYHFENVRQATYNKNTYYLFYEASTGYSTLEWSSGNQGFALTASGKYQPDNFPTILNSNGRNGNCVQLTTRVTGDLGNMVGMPIASGNLFMGYFDVGNALSDALSATQFGVTFYKEPVKLIGYYKYKAGEQFYENGKYTDRKDTFNLYALFYEKTNGIQMLDGHIAANNYEHPNMEASAAITSEDARETDEWTRFELTFDYLRYGKAVDPIKLADGKYNIAIVMASSKEGDLFKGAPGSTLLIDDMELICK